MVGTAFYIMEYCDGRVLWDPLLPEVPEEARLAIHRAKFETWRALHAVDYAALGLADFGRPGSYVARQISRWGKQYKASETEKIEAMDRLLDWLPAHLPANDETVLVHGDYRLDNMVFHPSEPRVLGVHRLGDLDPGRSAGRALLPLHAVAHAEGLGRPGRP